MGLKFMNISGSREPSGRCKRGGATTLGEPNPRRFTVLSVALGARHAVAIVQFPDCTTYEGRKLLLYKSDVFDRVAASGEMDPHFLESGDCPLARFAPTEEGKRAALALMNVLDEDG